MSARGSGAAGSNSPRASSSSRSAPVTMASTTSFTVTPHTRFTSMTSAIGSESHANARRRPTGRVNGNLRALGNPLWRSAPTAWAASRAFGT